MRRRCFEYIKMFSSEDIPFEARILNYISVIGAFFAFVALVARASERMPLITVAAAATTLLAIVATLCYILRNPSGIPIGTNFVVYFICVVMFPALFFLGGGVNSGFAPYFSLSVILPFLLLKGGSRVIAVILASASVIFCYASVMYLGFPVFPKEGLSRYQRFVDILQSIFVCGFFVGLTIVFQNRVYLAEKRKTNAANAVILRNEDLLSLVNEVANLLLTCDPEGFEDALRESMKKMTLVVNFDRAYIWRAETQNGEPVYRQIRGWTNLPSDGAPSLKDVYGVDWVPRSAAWDDLFVRRRYIADDSNNFPDELYSQFTALGIMSLMAFPVTLHDQFWGFVSFDNCHSGDLCDDQEADILQSGSLLLANAVERNETLLKVRRQLARQQLMSGISKSFISKEPMGILINAALANIGLSMGVARIIIAVFETDADLSRPMYFWVSDPKYSPKLSQNGFGRIIRSLFPRNQFAFEDSLSIRCDNALTDAGGRYRVFNEKGGIMSFICAPIYVDDSLWGAMSIEEHESLREWSDSDVILANAVSSSISNAVARDVMEKDRAAALEQAINASRAKGDFLSNMSHEIRTPMNAIIGMTAIGHSASTASKKDYAFEKIDNASKHLLGVINDILDMSKIEANKLELASLPFDFAKMIQKAANVVNFRVEERRQTLRVAIDGRIPIGLIGDDQRLSQVIINLLSNAVKFTPEEGEIRLDASLLSEKDGVCRIIVSVSDTGIGITDEQRSRLFRSFEQAEVGTSRKYGGAGLGLAISKRIVELMNGEIWVDSKSGNGAKFSFTATLKDAGPAATDALTGDNRAKTHGAGANESDNDFRGRAILLAEDVEVNREIVLALLEPTGVKIVCAENGKKAVSLFRDSPDAFDVIFMDVQMPEMDGYEATRRIRALSFDSAKKIPIIAMTANVFREDIEKCLAAGMNDHIGKPIDIDELMSVLKQSFKRRHTAATERKQHTNARQLGR